MRILIATNSYPTSKNPTRQVFVKHTLDELRLLNIRTDLVYNRYFRHFRSDLGSGNLLTSFLKAAVMALSYMPYFFYKSRNYDIIYSQGSVLPGIFVQLSKPFHRAKHVCYAHGSEEEYLLKRGFLYRISRFVLNRCDLVVTNSRYMQHLLEKEYGCKAAVIHPGYNHRLFFYKPVPKSTDLFFAGHAIERKGVDLILNAISEYRQYYREKGLVIRIHFSGGLETRYRRFAEKAGIDSLITFGGRLGEHRLAEAFRTSRIVLLPSLREPLGLVGIEAIASGALLVASDTGGVQEYVSGGENGLLFENGNYHDLHAKIVTALERYPTHRKRPAHHCKHRIPLFHTKQRQRDHCPVSNALCKAQR
jgi:L-malate glycosyltransferase